MFYTILFYLLPKPATSHILLFLLPQQAYRHWHEKLRLRAIEWHKQQLRAMDPFFLGKEAKEKLATARSEFYTNGGDPMSPECPQLNDFLPPNYTADILLHLKNLGKN